MHFVSDVEFKTHYRVLVERTNELCVRKELAGSQLRMRTPQG